LRGPGVLALYFRLPAPCWAWLSNDVPACRGLAVAWLIRGARSADVIPGIGRARHGLPPGQWKEMPVMAVVMIGVDPHKGSHTAVAIDAAEQPLGQLRVRA
jgi:hypothetical protein